MSSDHKEPEALNVWKIAPAMRDICVKQKQNPEEDLNTAFYDEDEDANASGQVADTPATTSKTAATTHKAPTTTVNAPQGATRVAATHNAPTTAVNTHQAPTMAVNAPQAATIGVKRPKPEGSHSILFNIEALACNLCDEEPATITFHPCTHKICCLDCSIRVKKCMRCNKKIERKTKDNGTPVAVPKVSSVLELAEKLSAHEEAQLCAICMEHKKSIVFNCGHLACAECSNLIQRCHMCQADIQARTKIYEF